MRARVAAEGVSIEYRVVRVNRVSLKREQTVEAVG